MRLPDKRVDIESVIKDPANYFARPFDVIKDARFTPGEKHRILSAWALDAELVSQAEAENMSGNSPPGLREVKLALLELEKLPELQK
jgi:hypothetical protein